MLRKHPKPSWFWAECTCGWESKPTDNKNKAEEDAKFHDELTTNPAFLSTQGIGFDEAGIALARQIIEGVPHHGGSVWEHLSNALDEIERLQQRMTEMHLAMVRITRETPYEEERGNVATLIAEVGTLRAKLAEKDDTVDTARHLAYVKADFESIRRGGSCRVAACLCSWRGPQRATLKIAIDDALEHECEFK